MTIFLKRLLAMFFMAFALGGASLAVFQTAHAEDAKPAVTAPAAATSDAATAAPAAVAPTPNKGDTTWMLISTALVLLMTLPGLSLFYGGLTRSKNILSIMMQCIVIFSLITILWVTYGYSLAFTEGSAFIGKFDRLFLAGITLASLAALPYAAAAAIRINLR